MDSQQVIVQKCNPNFSNSDPECNVEVPYFKDPYTVVIIGTLNDMDATQATVEFDVTIGPDCDGDSVYYTQDIAVQMAAIDGKYELGINVANSLNLSPAIEQLVPNCPVTCQLIGDDVSPVSNFDTTNGDLLIRTMDPSLDGKTLTYNVECISALSLSQSDPAMQEFNVGFLFQDCGAVISLNGASMSDYTQYWFTAG